MKQSNWYKDKKEIKKRKKNLKMIYYKLFKWSCCWLATILLLHLLMSLLFEYVKGKKLRMRDLYTNPYETKRIFWTP